MSQHRYRIGIDQSKLFKWPGWYSDYSTESEAIDALAKALKQDLEKFHIYEVKPNSEVPPAMRQAIAKQALLRLANEI